MSKEISGEPQVGSPLDGSEFIDGLTFAAQFMAIDHKEDGYAEDMLRASGFSQRELMKAQRKSGYESRTMCKIIRRAVPNSLLFGIVRPNRVRRN